MGDYTIKWKQSSPVEIELDSDALTWEDVLYFNSLKTKNEAGELSDDEMLNELTEVLTKLVGQDVRKLPARAVRLVLEAMNDITGGEQTKN